LRIHAAGPASIDLFIVGTISYRFLYGLVILHDGRRWLATVNLTSHPTRVDRRAGERSLPLGRSARTLGSRLRPELRLGIHAPCPLIGSIRRECLDHVTVFVEARWVESFLSAAVGMTWWNFYFRLYQGAIGAPQVVDLLGHLLRQSQRKQQDN